MAAGLISALSAEHPTHHRAFSGQSGAGWKGASTQSPMAWPAERGSFALIRRQPLPAGDQLGAARIRRSIRTQPIRTFRYVTPKSESGQAGPRVCFARHPSQGRADRKGPFGPPPPRPRRRESRRRTLFCFASATPTQFFCASGGFSSPVQDRCFPATGTDGDRAPRDGSQATPKKGAPSLCRRSDHAAILRPRPSSLRTVTSCPRWYAL